jgi:hypothetical protein
MISERKSIDPWLGFPARRALDALTKCTMFQSVAIDQTRQRTEHLVHNRVANLQELRRDQNSQQSAVFRQFDQHIGAVCICNVESTHVHVFVPAVRKLDAGSARVSGKSTPDQPESIRSK